VTVVGLLFSASAVPLRVAPVLVTPVAAVVVAVGTAAEAVPTSTRGPAIVPNMSARAVNGKNRLIALRVQDVSELPVRFSMKNPFEGCVQVPLQCRRVHEYSCARSAMRQEMPRHATLRHQFDPDHAGCAIAVRGFGFDRTRRTNAPKKVRETPMRQKDPTTP
jgi:hypothetical protein